MSRASRQDLGVMQGRLSAPLNGRIQAFPGRGWKSEFALAESLELRHIEWIFEHATLADNPLGDAQDTARLAAFIETQRVKVRSVCADYFMDRPYLKASPAERADLEKVLVELVGKVRSLGARHIDLPFVDSSRIGGKSNFSCVRDFISPALKTAATLGIDICLETDLNPADFRDLLDHIAHPSCAANYDSGNSASLGYDVTEEFAAYGKDVRTVHIKDRLYQGKTVPLGEGDTDFDALFAQLQRVDYRGPLVLQTARGTLPEAQAISGYMEFLAPYFKNYLGKD